MQLALLALDAVQDAGDVVEHALEILLQAHGIAGGILEHDGFVECRKDAAAGSQDGRIQQSAQQDFGGIVVHAVSGCHGVVVQVLGRLANRAQRYDVREMEIPDVLGMVLELVHEELGIRFPRGAVLLFGWRVVVLGDAERCGGVQAAEESVKDAFLQAHFLRNDAVLFVHRHPNVLSIVSRVAFRIFGQIHHLRAIAFLDVGADIHPEGRRQRIVAMAVDRRS
mmetsp:Transcript_14338/g.40809  ORF Transcript_14338/g.40809 Transcript_14338/m.40809 type:complete len:224 (-) Transcript_14338:860-1531(-)